MRERLIALERALAADGFDSLGGLSLLRLQNSARVECWKGERRAELTEREVESLTTDEAVALARARLRG